MTSRPEVRIDVRAHAKEQPAVAKIAAAGEPFRLLVLADLSGRASVGLCEPQGIAGRKCRAIDRDTFDEVLASIGPRLRVPLGATGGVEVAAAFASLDDFHPDALFDRLEVFGRLRRLRDRLSDPRTSAAAIAEFGGAPSGAASQDSNLANPKAPVGGHEPALSGESLLDSSLRATEANRASDAGRATGPGSSMVDRLVQELVAPHSVPRPDPRVADLVVDVERAIGEQMRALLSAAAFRDLEATWRGVYLLTRQLETDAQLQIHVLDVSRDELLASFADGADASRSGLAKQLVDATIGVPGGVPFAMVVGAYAFGKDEADLAVLHRITEVCARAGTAFAAAAAPGLFGCPGFAAGADPDDWQQPIDPALAAVWAGLRSRSEAAVASLVAPRFLMRLPYGKRSSPTNSFAFEEESAQCGHEELLWGNGAFLMALLVAETWREQGWRMRLGARDEVTGLPVHIRKTALETWSVPCAEVELTSRGAERIGGHGVVPLLSVRGADAVRFGSFHSIAANRAPLRGRWAAS